MKHHHHLFILKVALSVALGGLIIMLLWNAVIPSVTGLKSMSYLQALGFLLMCRILFGQYYERSVNYKLQKAWFKLTPDERASLLYGRSVPWWLKKAGEENAGRGPGSKGPCGWGRGRHGPGDEGESGGEGHHHDHENGSTRHHDHENGPTHDREHENGPTHDREHGSGHDRPREREGGDKPGDISGPEK
jgi:hypothetical protein